MWQVEHLVDSHGCPRILGDKLPGGVDEQQAAPSCRHSTTGHEAARNQHWTFWNVLYEVQVVSSLETSVVTAGCRTGLKLLPPAHQDSILQPAILQPATPCLSHPSKPMLPSCLLSPMPGSLLSIAWTERPVSHPVLLREGKVPLV